MSSNIEEKIRKVLVELAKKHVDSSTVSALCEKTGISRASFYHYYESMEDLEKKTRLYVVEKIDEQMNIFLQAYCKKLPVKNSVIFTEDDVVLLRYFVGIHNYMEFYVWAEKIIGERFKKRIINKKGEAYFNKNKAILEILLNGTVVVFCENLLNSGREELIQSYYYVAEIISEAFPEGIDW